MSISMSNLTTRAAQTVAPARTESASKAPSWIKPVAIAGGVAAGIGGIALALRSSHPALRGIGAGVAALAGVGVLTGCMPEGDQHTARGNTPDAVVDEILTSYDHSGNGQIDLDNPTGLARDDERVRVEGRNRKETTTDWDPNDEDFLPWGNPWGDSTTTRWTERRLVSGAAMFDAANENGDRVVTRDELLDLVKQYDDFGDGELGKAEIEALQTDNPERFDDWVRTS